MNLLCNLSHLACIAVTGDKAAEFLQGQLTCDVREVNPNTTRLAAHCNAKGRVLATLRLLHYANQLYACLPAEMLAQTLPPLQKVAMLSRVKLEPDPDLAAIGCYGAEVAQVLLTFFGKLPEQTDTATYKNGALIIRVHAELPRFEIFANPDILITLKAQLRDFAEQDFNAWRLLDIQERIPNIYPETRDLFTPHMLNYPALNGVNFKKGCYVGQEVVARTHYLGKVKRQLHYFTEPSSMLSHPGDKILNAAGQETGVVVDVVRDSEGMTHVLAVMQLER